jgi:hypothetical protein
MVRSLFGPTRDRDHAAAQRPIQRKPRPPQLPARSRAAAAATVVAYSDEAHGRPSAAAQAQYWRPAAAADRLPPGCRHPAAIGPGDDRDVENQVSMERIIRVSRGGQSDARPPRSASGPGSTGRKASRAAPMASHFAFRIEVQTPAGARAVRGLRSSLEGGHRRPTRAELDQLVEDLSLMADQVASISSALASRQSSIASVSRERLRPAGICGTMGSALQPPSGVAVAAAPGNPPAAAPEPVVQVPDGPAGAIGIAAARTSPAGLSVRWPGAHSTVPQGGAVTAALSVMLAATPRRRSGCHPLRS